MVQVPRQVLLADMGLFFLPLAHKWPTLPTLAQIITHFILGAGFCLEILEDLIHIGVLASKKIFNKEK